MAATPEDAQTCLDRVLAEAKKRNVFRGQVLVVEQAGAAGPGRRTRLPDQVPRHCRSSRASRSSCPTTCCKVVERNVIGLLAHADALRQAGRSTRHGVLFHGPPGVGKTLVTKYLARACPDYTVILLTGRQLRLVRESCVLARLLQPALMVIEDVDLIAADREQNFDTTLLHDLMDEMDGLGPKADVIFLLTTNRPRILETALAARPGRVDQAIYFPLPDRECRRRLFAHFAHGLDLSARGRRAAARPDRRREPGVHRGIVPQGGADGRRARRADRAAAADERGLRGTRCANWSSSAALITQTSSATAPTPTPPAAASASARGKLYFV